MSRGRRNSRRGGSSGPSRAAELAALEQYLSLNLFSWMRADTFTPAGANVGAFPDRVAPGVGARAIDANHTFSQGTAANQVLAPVANATLNGQLAVKGIIASNTKYASSLVALDWAWANSAAGTTVAAVTALPASLTGDQWVAASFDGVTNGLDCRTSTAALVARVLELPAAPASRTVTGLTASAAALVTFRHATALSPDSELRCAGSTPSAGDYSATPAGLSPTVSMRILGASFGGSSYDGHIADIMFAQSVSAVLLANIQRYTLLRYRVAS